MAPKVQPAAKKSKAAAAEATAKATAAAVATATLEEGDEDGEESAAGEGLTPAIGREEPTSPMTPKNFRNHPDMENFFRFIYENDLRLEALEIIDQIIMTRKAKKSGKKEARA